MTFSRFLVSLTVPLGLLLLSASAHAARPVKDVVLFRVDASAAPGSYVQHASSESGDSYDSYAFAIGPRLGLNLGYAPSRLIRLGIGGAAAFSMNVAENDGIPNAEIDGWARWTVGPSVGFRFGPKVPIELDVALNFANFTSLGSQGSIPGTPMQFDALAKQYGMTTTALLLFRPGGADSAFALHAGLESTWGMATSVVEDGTQTSTTGHLQSLLLGISIGL